MIKLHTKNKSNLNYYLFTVDTPDDVSQVAQGFQILFEKEPLFTSSCVLNNKSYVLIGTLELHENNEFDSEDFQFSLLSTFKRPIKSQMQNVQQVENFYFCNFKDSSINDIIKSFLIPLLNDLIKWTATESTFKKIPSDRNPQIIYFQCAPDEIKHRIRFLIPFFIKQEFMNLFDFPVFSTKSSELPIIIIKNNDRDSENQIDLKKFTKIKEYIEEKNYSKVINFCEFKSSFYFSVEDNEKAWNIINHLKYTKFHDEILQLTHFLDINEMDLVKQWNILVVNIRKEEDYNSIFKRFSKYKDKETESDQIKRILAIKTYDDSNKKNAQIQFLNKSDAYEAFLKDKSHIKIYNFSMIIYHFDAEQEEELHDIFPKASYIVERQNNSPRTRPTYHIFFDCKKDLTEALLLSGNINKKSVAEENDDEETNKKYDYQITSGAPGIYSNGLRAFCIAYMKQEDINKIDTQLIKQTWKKNTVEIYDVDRTVQLSEAIEALNSFGDDCCLESLVFWKKSKIIATFLQNKYFKKATSKKTIKINELDYSISPKNSV
ncbi:hypothetical protein M9Y10_034540 [Tritrichomonas musculus]|uniref:RRM domain-containing protein n=1 Tax=Tritrichomonas musculus TaxID=1915356 RepID=A0ABR2KFY8_9EUKA